MKNKSQDVQRRALSEVDPKLASLETTHKAVRASMNPDQLKTAREADEAFESINDDVFDFASEDRVRQAGYTPQQAEDIAFILKTKKIQVGQIFDYKGRALTLTPFNTVVPVQTYLTAIQDRLFEITTVEQEVMVSQLKTQVQEFTSLTFLGLITLAFKRLYTNLTKGK